MLEAKECKYNIQEEKIRNLEKQLDEQNEMVQNYKKDVCGYENSISWGITKPLRYILKKLKNNQK